MDWVIILALICGALGVAYSLMTDFKTPVGARNNFNGYGMSFGFGFVF